MRYFHGTTNRRFKAGEVIRPGSKVGTWSNWTVHDDLMRRELVSGRVVHPNDVVWITATVEEAEYWAQHSTLKATQAEIRRMGAGGIAVYEVEPVGLDTPVDPHGDGEVCCATARVVREVSFDAFALDLCDECGDTATVGVGSDDQRCSACDDERSPA